jgi:hypothetical protein
VRSAAPVRLRPLAAVALAALVGAPSLAAIPCDELPVVHAFVLCRDGRCTPLFRVAEQQGIGCRGMVTIDSLSETAWRALQPRFESLALDTPAIYDARGVPFAFDRLESGDASWLVVVREERTCDGPAVEALRDFWAEQATYAARERSSARPSPRRWAAASIVGALLWLAGAAHSRRRRRRGQPWVGWILAPLSVQLLLLSALFERGAAFDGVTLMGIEIVCLLLLCQLVVAAWPPWRPARPRDTP